MNKENPWGFPIMSIDEIIACLQTMEIDCTREMLMQPTDATIVPIYERLTEVLVVTRSDFAANSGAASLRSAAGDSRDHLENVSEQFSTVKLIIHLMKSVGVLDFNFSDLTTPTSKRVIRNISGVINYAKFHDEHIILYDEAMREVNQLTQRKAEVDAQVAKAESELAAAKRDREQEEPAKAALSKEVDSLRRTVKALEQRSNELRDEADGLNKRVEASKNEMRQLKADVKAKTDEHQFLQSQIVSSPEKLQAEMKGYEVKIARSNQELAQLSTELTEFASKNTALAEVSKRLRQCTDRARKCAGDVERLQNYEKMIDEARARIAELDLAAELADKEALKVTKELGAADTNAGDAAESFEKKKLRIQNDIEAVRKRAMSLIYVLLCFLLMC